MAFAHLTGRALRWSTVAAAALGGGYAALVGRAWLRYGQRQEIENGQRDRLLDTFMPAYEVAERHSIAIDAPASIVLAAAKEMKLDESPLIRAIFRTRELVLGAEPDMTERPRGLLALTQTLGWRILADVPDREVVVGAVTQPWLGKVVFRGLSPEEFQTFRQPDFVKIVWTLRADPTGSGSSIFRTETRVSTTDGRARSRFRWYWARFSPGIGLIRTLTLAPLKRDAEARYRAMTRPI